MIRVYVDDMQLFLQGISVDLPERTRNLFELLENEMDSVHLEGSDLGCSAEKED